MAIDETKVEELLKRVSRRESSALGRLLEYHRKKLRRMVAARIDQRLAARIDPSEVVQEALLEAHAAMPAYIRDRRVPFYVWLRGITRNRLIWWTRRHTARQRDAFRDQPLRAGARGDSAPTLAQRMIDRGSSPSERAIRADERERALALLNCVPAQDRQFLELRYVNGLSIAAIASQLGISLSAAQMRHLRALERMRERAGSFREESHV